MLIINKNLAKVAISMIANSIKLNLGSWRNASVFTSRVYFHFNRRKCSLSALKSLSISGCLFTWDHLSSSHGDELRIMIPIVVIYEYCKWIHFFYFIYFAFVRCISLSLFLDPACRHSQNLRKLQAKSTRKEI